MVRLPIWTIGHSSHPLSTLTQLLSRHDIEYVADVRSFPYSRFAPHFNREPLRDALLSRRVGYIFLGHELGGRPSANDHYDHEGRALYGPMSQEPGFCEAVDRLLVGAARHRIALLCSEGEPTECHRRLLVGKVLAEQGAELRHILPTGELLVERQVQLGPGQRSLFEEGAGAWRSTRSVSHRRRLNTSSAG